MIQLINRNKIFLALLISLNVACNSTNEVKKNDYTVKSSEVNKNNKLTEVKEYPLSFLIATKIGADSHGDSKIQNDIESQIKPLKIAIKGDDIYIKNKGKESFYKSDLTAIEFFEYDYLHEFYREYCTEKFGINLPNTITTIRNKNAHSETSILTPYFEDAFFVDDILVFDYDGFAVSFGDKAKVKVNKTAAYKTDVQLPIEMDISKTLDFIELPNAKYSIQEEKNYDYSYIARLPKKEKLKPIIFSGCYDSGHCNEYFVVLDENNKQISTLPIYYNTAPDGNVPKFEFCEYLIDEKYNITLNIVSIEKNLETRQTVNRIETEKKYTINLNGKIETTVK